jgi:hypothetical protein
MNNLEIHKSSIVERSVNETIPKFISLFILWKGL